MPLALGESAEPEFGARALGDEARDSRLVAGDQALVLRDEPEDARELFVGAPRVVLHLGRDASQTRQGHDVLELEVDLRRCLTHEVLGEEFERFGHASILPGIARTI